MPTSVNDIVSRMRQALALSEPDLDTSIGTPIRKILDAVGEVIAEASIDTYLLDYQYDVEAKIGADLDDFVSLFGFTRLPPKRATGSVVFERALASAVDIIIPNGTQIATEDSVPIVVQTVVSAFLRSGETSISVPVQALLGGAAGNVPANALRRRLTPVQGVGTPTNTTALSGGADGESDAQLRARFKKTVFRNLAGTEQMFLGVALDHPNVTQANVIGASKRHREQIELVSNTGTSTLQNIKYTYPGSAAFGTDIDAGGIFVPGVDYNFNATGAPTITSLDPTKVPDGIYDLEFEYLPTASRNDPSNGITNRVDVYVNGRLPTKGSAVIVFKNNRAFNTTPNNAFNVQNFRRLDGTTPVAGNYFIAYPFAPVLDPSIGDSLEIAQAVYVEGTDYWLVNDVTAEGGTPSSFSGIEFKATPVSGPLPTNGVTFSVDFIFNAVPRDVDRAIRVWRLITTDVQVHEAKQILLNLFLAVMYAPGYNEGAVRPEVEAALSDYISRVSFDGVVQVSDLLGVVQRVPGVDAVRFLTEADPWRDPDEPEEAPDHFAIERVSEAGTFLTRYEDGGVAVDVLIGDDELPVFNSVVLVPKAQNTMWAYLAGA